MILYVINGGKKHCAASLNKKYGELNTTFSHLEAAKL